MARIEYEVEAIRLRALEQEPFWALVACKLDIIVCYEWMGRAVDTAATDGEHLWINPDYWNGLTLEAKVSLFLHEIAHVALAHHLRRNDRDPQWWNVAGDHVINNILKEQGNHIPEKWLCDPKHSGSSEERVYAGIYPGDGPPPPPPPPGREPPHGPGDGPVVLVPSDKEGDEEGDGGSGEGEGGGPGENGMTEAPAGLDAPGEVWDATAPDGSPLSEEDRADKMREIIEDIQQAKHMAKTCGRGGGANLRRATDRLIKPKMNWRSYLSRWVTEKGKPHGRTWSKLDRRSMVNRIYQPGQIMEGMDWLVIAVDVSGSIAYPEFKAFLSHIESIRKTTQINRISFVPFNHMVLMKQIVEAGPKDKLPKELITGGGTCFAPIFNWVRREEKNPDGIIIFTDLCCSDYGEPVTTSILWASSSEVHDGKDNWYCNKPPFGEAIEIDINR